MTSGTDYDEAPFEALVDHIVATHHSYLDRQLPLIAQLLSDHARKYWLRHPEFLAARAMYYEAWQAISSHLLREETTAVPLLHAYQRDSSTNLKPLADNIDDHVKEHAAATAAFAAIRAKLWDFVAPADVGPEVAVTFQLLAELQADLVEHIHLENDVLFPRVREVVR